MCSYGPVVLGHQHPAVEEAAAAQAALGDCQNGPGPVMVDLAELLVRTVRHADWAMFAKNGTDATTMCCTIARAQTGRRKILVATGAYHGAAPWCTPRPAGVTAAGPRQPRLLHLQRPGQRAAGRRRGRRRPGGHPGQPVQARRRVRPGTGRSRVRPRPARAVRRHRGRADPRRRALRVPAAPGLELGADRRGPRPVGLEQGDRERPPARRGAGQRRVPRRGAAGVRHRLVLVLRRPDGGRDRHDHRARARSGRSRPWSGPAPALRDGILAQARSWDLPVNYTGPAAMPYLTFAGDRGPRAGRRVRRRRPCAAAPTCIRGTTGSSPPP